MANRNDSDDIEQNDGDSLPFILLVPNMVTTIGLCAGLTAIRFIMAGQFAIAVWLILFSTLIDGLDGLVARRLKATSEFGAQLDSLSDFLNFGVAPGLLIYQMALVVSEKSGGWIFVLVYVVCCCMRLARFNVSQIKSAANGTNSPKPKHFTGVPAPAGALLALLPAYVTFETGIRLSEHPVLIELYIATVGALMVSRLPTFSPKSLRIPKERAVWFLIALALVLGTMLAEFWRSMIAVDIAYMLTLIWSFIRNVVALRRATK
jgi:CDP-diacylglycerol--serine O-phosphatidyltransferase